MGHALLERVGTACRALFNKKSAPRAMGEDAAMVLEWLDRAYQRLEWQLAETSERKFFYTLGGVEMEALSSREKLAVHKSLARFYTLAEEKKVVLELVGVDGFPHTRADVHKGHIAVSTRPSA